MRSVSSTRIATLPTSSWSSRSLTMRAVSRVPDCPASGEVLMPTVMPSAGSSTAITGSGRGSSGSAIVSPIVISGMPASAMISPGPASSAGTRSQALGHVELGHPHALDRAVAAAPGHRAGPCGSCPGARGRARAGRRRGRRRGWSRAPGAGGPPRSSGAGMRSTSRSNSGRRSVPSTPSSSEAQPALAFV